MTRIEAKSKRHLSAKFAAGLAVSAFLLLGALAAPASAENRSGGSGDHPTVVYADYYGYGQQQYYRQPSYSYGYGQPQYYRQPSYGYGYQQQYYGQPYNSGVGVYLPGIGIRIQ